MSLLCRFWPLFWARFAFYQCDWSEIYQKCINDYSAPWYEILKNSIENLLRYLEICHFYVDFHYSFGRGLRSINAINLIFERNRAIIIIHHPAKFQENRSRTFWVNRVIHTQTDRQIHADENNTSPKTKFLGEVITNEILITWPKNFVFGQVLFSSASLCLSVCVCLCVFKSL